MRPEILAEKMDGETVDWMKKTCAEKKIILTGSIIIEDSSQDSEGNKKFYNRLIWMLPNGEYGYYDKRHLFAYGDEHTHFSAGNKRLIACVKGWRINLLVCYDLRFPVWARQAPAAGPAREVGEPEYDRIGLCCKLAGEKKSCLENVVAGKGYRKSMLCNRCEQGRDDGNEIKYSGDSMIVDALGEILYQKTNEEDVFTYTLEKAKLSEIREKFPFMKDSDSFIINS